jgi:hypothetical protein
MCVALELLGQRQSAAQKQKHAQTSAPNKKCESKQERQPKLLLRVLDVQRWSAERVEQATET